VIGLLGVLVATGLWWLYFDLISDRPPRPRLAMPWLYLHLPLVRAIAAGGEGVLNTVENAGESLSDEVRWLLVGALAVAMRRCTGPIPHANGGIAVLRTGEGPVARRR